MEKVIIFGTGKSMPPVLKTLNDNCVIQAFLDNNEKKIGTQLFGKKIIPPSQVSGFTYDYIVVATVDYDTVVNQLETLQVKKDKILLYYSPDVNYDLYRDIFNIEEWRKKAFEVRIETKLENFIKRQEVTIQNMEYEIAAKIEKGLYSFPKICTVEETVHKIIRDRVSISRYGDGEFEIIAGHAKDSYQNNNHRLAERLKEILKKEIPNHIVGLASDYGEMDDHTEENKYQIRKYMTKEKRAFHMSLLDLERQYYDAYMSRPYVIFKYENKIEIENKFLELKKIWDNKEIVFIEGITTRMGVGNDLFHNASMIQRILAPEKNAFDKYTEILEAAKKLDKSKLILIALGPAATVLAYDLAKEGYWALDIGHLDIEYEWFLRGNGATYIPHKYNNEVYGDEEVIEIVDAKYEKEIIAKIE